VNAACSSEEVPGPVGWKAESGADADGADDADGVVAAASETEETYGAASEATFETGVTSARDAVREEEEEEGDAAAAAAVVVALAHIGERRKVADGYDTAEEDHKSVA
jgi:hypothetical protein